ncbi:MAG: hypothetical protein PUD34_00025 [bacterium]|nr:hypothetical protein [bacterium]
MKSEKKEEKTLYNEIFQSSNSPKVTTTDANKEITDAIDSANLNDVVNMEEIFTLDDKKKTEVQEPSLNSQSDENQITLDDASLYSFIDDTLVNVKLDLHMLDNIGVNELPKLDKETIKSETKPKDDITPLVKPKEEVVNATITPNELEKNLDKLDKIGKQSHNFWINYAIVAVLIIIAITSSLTFLIKQFK